MTQTQIESSYLTVTSVAPVETSTVTTTTTTEDMTAELTYGSLMAIFLALFLGTLVVLIGSRSAHNE